jgi:hypothetical protein
VTFSTPEITPEEERGNGFLSARERRQHRIDHGMCPECGKEAAPYYLCWDCRLLSSIGKRLNKFAARGICEKIGSGKNATFRLAPDIIGAERSLKLDEINKFRWGDTLLDMDANDKRARPRINRRPIDIDETMMAIFRNAGKPLDMQEIYMAWGALRSRRVHQTLATDMTAIIKAQRKRDERNAKRAALVARQQGAFA